MSGGNFYQQNKRKKGNKQHHNEQQAKFDVNIEEFNPTVSEKKVQQKSRGGKRLALQQSDNSLLSFKATADAVPEFVPQRPKRMRNMPKYEDLEYI